MARLRDRNKQIPNGLKFYQPETGWRSPRFASFAVIVRMLIAHRMGRPMLLERFGWATDEATVSDEVDSYNATLCERMGWTDYIMEGGPSPPLYQRPQRRGLARSLAQSAAGASAIVEWLRDKSEAVPRQVADARAGVCAQCPMNVPEDLLSFFTRPVANGIIDALNRRKGMDLRTMADDKLGICDACGCVLKLKVHLPLQFILDHMEDPEKARLWKECWIGKERA